MSSLSIAAWYSLLSRIMLRNDSRTLVSTLSSPRNDLRSCCSPAASRIKRVIFWSVVSRPELKPSAKPMAKPISTGTNTTTATNTSRTLTPVGIFLLDGVANVGGTDTMIGSGLPQEVQNFAESRFCLPQLGQNMGSLDGMRWIVHFQADRGKVIPNAGVEPTSGKLNRRCLLVPPRLDFNIDVNQ